jgi:hypothetical protein
LFLKYFKQSSTKKIMSKIKFSILLIGGLLIGSNLQAAQITDKDRQPVKQQGTPSEAVAVEEQVIKEEPVTREELEGVRGEVATLQELWQRTLENNTARTQRSLVFTGIAQLRYSTQQNATKNGFDLNALVLNFQGNLKRDYEQGRNINYLFSLVSPSGANADGSTDFRVSPLDAYITAFLLPSLNPEDPLLSISAGKLKKPFGLEAQAGEDKKPTIKLAQSARAGSGIDLDARDIGVVIRGDLFPQFDPGFRYRVPAIEYSIGYLNGRGSDAYGYTTFSDDNKHKDISARIVFNAPVDYSSVFRGLSVGGSYYSGKSGVNGNINKNRRGFDISYVNTPVGFTFEYAKGEDGTIKKSGHTLTIFYNQGEQFVSGYKAQDRYDDWYPTTFQPFVRFDRWDPNTSISGDRKDITTIGLNWFFAQTTKLQVNYNFIKEESNKIDNNEFLVQLQYTF